MVKLNSFQDFFKKKFISERAYTQFGPSCFSKTYTEMARPGVGEDLGDVVKRPISIDKEDIDFLNQFPQKYWRSAIHQRYEMLHDQLLKLHDTRMNGGETHIPFKELEKKIKDAMISTWHGDPTKWDGLEGFVSPDVLNRFRKNFTQEYFRTFGKTNSEVLSVIENEAHKEAYEEIKSKTEGINEKGPTEFKLGKETIVAHPYLNRLYHKIERTKGMEHDPKSGLHDFGMDKGAYGYDLGFPKKFQIAKSADEDAVKRMTRGVGSWTSKKTTSDAIGDLLSRNQHKVYGDLNIPEDAVWKTPMGENGRATQDHWIWDRTETKYLKKFESELQKQKFGTATERLMEARKLAKEATLNLAKEGKLSAPPVPGIPDEDRKVKVDENGNVTLPLLYLPHVKKMVKVRGNDGQVTERPEWIPIVNGSHFYRELGKHEDDFKLDPITGQRTGEYDWNNLKGRMTGHPDENGVKPFVKVEPDEYQKSGGFGHQADAAFHPNQNSKGRFFISKGDPEYQQAYNAVFGDMELKTDRISGAQLYDDFRKGILRCSGGNKCGGGSTTERRAIEQNIEGIHSVIVMHAMNNLGDPKLTTSNGRIGYADAFTGTFAQTNLGDGPRRRRILDSSGKTISRDATTSGEGGDMSIGDTVDAQSRSKTDFYSDAEKRGQGGRILPTTDWLEAGRTSYNIDEYRKILSKMESEAKKADETKASITPGDIHQLTNSILDSENVILAIKNHLVKIYQQNNPSRSPEELNKEVEDEIKGWILDGAGSSEQLLNKFKTHPLVVKIIGHTAPQEPITQQEKPVNPQEKQVLSGEAKDEADYAIEIFKEKPLFDSLTNLRKSGDWNKYKQMLMPKAGKPYSDLLEKWANDNLEIDPAHEETTLTALQNFISDKFDLNTVIQPNPNPVAPVNKPAITTPLTGIAAREIEKRHPGSFRNPDNDQEDIDELAHGGKTLDYIHHPEFEHEDIHPNSLHGLNTKVNDWAQKGWIDPALHNATQQKLLNLYKKKTGNPGWTN